MQAASTRLHLGLVLNDVEPGADHRSLPADSIAIRGAREHNLKNLSVDIPHNQFVVVIQENTLLKKTLKILNHFVFTCINKTML